MDGVRDALAAMGNTWDDDVPSTLMKLFEPLQAQKNQEYAGRIKAEKAIKYGPDERHRIDVYSPVNAEASRGSGKPVVVFIHGGGLVGGDNDFSPNINSNIGNYFTSKGCITCLVTYRLAGGLHGGHFPNGAEDVAAAVRWIRANISAYGGDPGKVVALGQSAGGQHLASAIFLGMLDPDSKPLLRGAVLLSAAFTMDTRDPARARVLQDWFRANDAFEINSRWSPAALFRQHYLGTTTTTPRRKLPFELLLAVGEAEADEILEGTFEFINDYRKRFAKVPLLEVLKGHNHVSYTFGLGLDGPLYEAVGEKLLGFIKDCTE